MKNKKPIVRTKEDATALIESKQVTSRYVGEVTASSKRNRPATYYKLSEKDHPIIIEGLRKFASIYHIAMRIGCGYTSLKRYIHQHPELEEVQKEAKEAVNEFVEAQFLKKIAGGHIAAMCFYAERKMGWTNRQEIDTNLPIPNVVLGVIPEEQLPADGLGEPVKLSEQDPNLKLLKKPEAVAVREPEPQENDDADDDDAGDADDGWGFDGDGSDFM